jgi:Tfp pilus assembly protein PilP
MMRKRALPFVFAVIPAVAGAQAAAPQAPAAQTPTATAGAATPAVPVEPQGFEYHSEGRRDPFVSLIRRGTDTARSVPATRAPGLGGLETSEVTLRGTLQTSEGFIAMLAGADNRTYIVRVGDRLLDGTIRSIGANAIVILQQVNDDPLSPEKQREVRKTIRQADEAK